MEFNLSDFKRILDIGGGTNPFSLATEVIDWRVPDDTEGKTYYELDVCSDKFPFGDGEIDFIYCRQMLEDLTNPVFALREMMRVGKMGYIETPHVLTELKKSVQSPSYRGWAHHNWLVWSVNNTIKLLPKSHAFDFLAIDDAYLESIPGRLYPRGDYKMANNYFVWDGQFQIKRYINGKDFDFVVDYDKMIKLAIEESVNYHTVVKFVGHEEKAHSCNAIRPTPVSHNRRTGVDFQKVDNDVVA